MQALMALESGSELGCSHAIRQYSHGIHRVVIAPAIELAEWDM